MKVNIGGLKGKNKSREDWHILDWVGKGNKDPRIINHNLNRLSSFPISGDSVDAYYTSHTLEHVYPDYIFFVLCEIQRTLKTDGLVRIVVPDIEVGIQQYIKRETYVDKAPFKPAVFPETRLGNLMGWFTSPDKKHSSGHHMAFDGDTLKALLQRASFKDIKFLSYNVCSPIFNGLDHERYKDWSIYVECTK